MDMDFFGVGPLEILFVFLIAFVIFGPKRLFDISRNAGKAMHDLSRAATGFTAKIEKEMDGNPVVPENPARPENTKIE
jgi:TatA/E family protein of Tat protein translocase